MIVFFQDGEETANEECECMKPEIALDTSSTEIWVSAIHVEDLDDNIGKMTVAVSDIRGEDHTLLDNESLPDDGVITLDQATPARYVTLRVESVSDINKEAHAKVDIHECLN